MRNYSAHTNRIATMGQFAASIAHEVNQPIGATLMNAETALRWLAASPPKLESARQCLDRIITDSKRGGDIISRIRDLAKKTPAEREDLGINEIALEVIGLTRSEMSDRGVLVRTRLTEGLPRILSDRVQLQQVILNLIMNALEAMDEVAEGSRELLISTGNAEAGGVLLTVTDTGPGLSPTSPARIFEAFYTTKPSGLGMGLSICRSIVETHGGRLWATPNQPRGAVFRRCCRSERNRSKARSELRAGLALKSCRGSGASCHQLGRQHELAVKPLPLTPRPISRRTSPIPCSCLVAGGRVGTRPARPSGHR